jgi:hypothetical protein
MHKPTLIEAIRIFLLINIYYIKLAKCVRYSCGIMPFPEICVTVMTQTNVATTQKHHPSSPRRGDPIAHYLVKNKNFVTALNETRNKGGLC